MSIRITKDKIVRQAAIIAQAEYCKELSELSAQELHEALSRAVMAYLSDNWNASEAAHASGRRACYLSAEFLVGRAVYNNLMCLGLSDEIEKQLQAEGRSLAELEDIEDAALGNGGLGRLAACFLDSAATLDLPLDGYGIRYRYGIFKQYFENGFQKEAGDDWTKYGDPWSVRRDDEAVGINIGYPYGKVIAVPYDMPIIGYGTKHISTLRLWQAEAAEGFDFDLFNDGDYDESVWDKNRAEDISRVLYPNDNSNEGKLLRLAQEYFFSAASMKDMLRRFKAAGHTDFAKFPELFTVQLNDTHPVIAIPELVRLLTAEEELTFDEAVSIARRTFNYTNHTVMQEALEKWDVRLMKELLPDIYKIIVKLDKVVKKELARKRVPAEKRENMQIIYVDQWGNTVINMAYMAIFFSQYVNGVAAIHTEILKADTLRDWYEYYPERFQNKTNGITQRRWIGLCNAELSALITELLGSDAWLTDLDRLRELEKYADDDRIIDRFMAIKRQKRVQLAEYVRKHDGVDIDPDWLFDIQIKRLHEYKRQFLNALTILAMYFKIKDGELKDLTPTVFIFGAKSAPGYARAKGIIKLINEIAKLVEADPEVSKYIKVVFVQNYNVSYAEKLVSAADISEQISTAGTEASGTGNMKLMLNGAVTLGTYDGANIEIVEEAGEENNYIFGARVEEIDRLKAIDALNETRKTRHRETYNPLAIYRNDPLIKRVLDALTDGTLSDGRTGIFKELKNSILRGASWHRPDHYFLLLDFHDYLDTRIRLSREAADRKALARKGWLNMCAAGKFSSDRTIKQYAEEIWHIQRLADARLK